MKKLVYSLVALSLVSALAYVLAGVGVLGVGNLDMSDAPPGVTYAAAGGYLFGGLLILLRRRRLLVTGAVVNAFVIIVFILFYIDQTDVLFSGAGLATKIPQLFLEAGLIVLLFRDRD